jgi:peptidyl-prolyl cis-trans isomerase SurA
MKMFARKNNFHVSRQYARIICCALFVFAWAGGSFGIELDRLIAAVNGKVITDGDLKLARGLSAVVFTADKKVPDSRSDEIDHLIDLELMRQELKNFQLAQDDESRIESRLQSLRDYYAQQGGLQALLQRLGLQESELVSYLRLQSSILKFVDFRFRPFVGVSAEEIQKYYEGRLREQLQKSGLELPPLTQVSARIEEILKEEKMNAMLDSWITEIRRNSKIEYFIEK